MENPDRYLRHSIIDWFDQESVSNSKVLVIGCGAIGNECLKNLALLGVSNFTIVDFDKIEIHNLTRSVLFRESDVGRSKTEASKLRIIELNPQAQVNAIDGDFWQKISLDEFQAHDLVICAVDNFEARIRLNLICLLTRTSFINGGIDSRYASVELFPFENTNDCSCYECNLPASVYARMNERYSCGWLKKQAFLEKKIPTTIVTSAISGALITAKAMRLLDHETTESSKVIIDSFSGASSLVSYDQNSGCPACSRFIGINSFHVLASPPGITDKEKVLKIDDDDSLTIFFGEPIIKSIRCTNCDFGYDDYWEEASIHDDTLTTCSQCAEPAVEVTIVDQITVGEANRAFRSRRIPGKFIYVIMNKSVLTIDLGEY